ncbi:hypothetical protein [Spirulina subsalsa]|nr:hypothetical protein [Spirulina subsalsa]
MFHPVAPFTPQQIVYLEANLEQESCGFYGRLYAEVIQWIPQRGMCWVRPLFWAKYSGTATDPQTDPQVEDLRQASDLVWPDHAFQVALDTETIPLLMQLNPSEGLIPDPGQQAIARQRLNRVMKFFWST